MSDFPGSDVAVTPTHIHTYGSQSAAATFGQLVGPGLAAITWVANHAVYIPMTLPHPYHVRRVGWVNGSTITTSNADFGIYTGEGTKIYSTGSTALSGASGTQYVDATDFVLPAGRYYFAWVCDNTTNRAHGATTVTAIFCRLAGILQQGSALPLPATMTSAVAATQALYPICGVTRTASGF